MKRPTARKSTRGRGGQPAETVLEETKTDEAEAIPAVDTSPGAEPEIAATGARIGIHLEPSAPAAWAHGRHDFVIRGQIVATARIADIVLLTSDGRVGQMTFGKAEAAMELILPDGAAALQHNFVFQLPSQHAEDATQIEFSIIARLDGDTGVRTAFTIEIDPKEPGQATVVSGPVVAGISAAGLAPAAILHAEMATIDTDGNLRVRGWAVSREMLVEVRVSVDDNPVGAAVLGGVRADVESVHRNYLNARNSGFGLSVPVGGLAHGAQGLRIRATTLSGSSIETVMPIEWVERQEIVVPVPPPVVAPEPPPPPPPPPPRAAEAASDPRRAITTYWDELSLGTDGILWIRGWAVSAVGIASINVRIDDMVLGEAEIGQPRLDVGDKYADIPAARFSGFRFKAKAFDTAAGMHVVTVSIRNGLDDVYQHRQGVLAEPINRAVVTPMPTSAPTARRAPPPTPVPKMVLLKLETPVVAAGAMTQLVTGRLTLEGWVLGRTGIAGVDVFLDEQPLGSAHYGLVRRDIAAAHPEWPDSLRSGFAFHCPSRALRDGDHTLSLRVNAKDGETHVESFRLTVAKAAANPEFTKIKARLPNAQAALYADILHRLDWQPWFRIVLRDADAEAPDRLARTLASLERQIYPNWRADVLGNDPALRETVAAMVADGRLDADRVGFLGENAVSLEIAPGNRRGPVAFAGVLSCGDQLGCDALAEFAVHSGLNREAELIYADEVRESPTTGQREAFFKPAFSPDLLFSTNYIGRPWFATPSLLARAGASPRSLRQLGEYDLLLRCAERGGPGRIHSIPGLLCDRAAGTWEAPEREMRALADAAARRGIDATIEPGCLSGTWRPRRNVVTDDKVSIIVPTAAAGDFIRTCLSTLKHDTAYRNIEIVAIDNIPADGPDAAGTKAWLRDIADTVIDMPGAFNWSRFNNRAAAAATGAFLLFLDDDIAVLNPGWLDAMLEHAERPEVGVVGPQLLYPDDKVQHAGLFLAGPDGARLAFRFAADEDPGYFGLARTQRNVMAVSGACMLMRRATFETLGGFDEAYEISHGDLDFCLRVHAAGLLTVYTPHASLLHHEAGTRAALPDGDDRDRFNNNWRMRLAQGDPFYNRNLSTAFDDYRADDEPARIVFNRHPLLSADAIRSILVLKADDVGEFVTALPAIRRLKAHFPEARLAVLADPAARGLAALEPAIDETIGFTLVTSRSAHGKREADPEELAALSALLAPYGFDLAIDLHKHPDTRPLLRCAGAAVTAGFDHLGRFPWLDVSLEWEGDRRLHPKRYHVADDLLHLVDAVATATQEEPSGIAPDAVLALRATADIPATLRRFQAGTVVCIHAGAGSEIRQWPVGHFAELINMLVARNQVRVLLVGDDTAAEAETEAAVLALVTPDERVLSQVGLLGPDVLPAVIAGCALFVGNDSGLKHIAGALGVPTIGVHSGVVDPVEWAPQGTMAVAVARAMSCSPCYLTRIENCPREFACMRGLPPLAVHRLCETMLARPIPAAPKSLPVPPKAAAQAEPVAEPEAAAVPADAPAERRPRQAKKAPKEPLPKPVEQVTPKKPVRAPRGRPVPALLAVVPDEVGDD
jgi:ADP-heptose:LPS heptosyltransferase/GT2 family glycosyltransferase